MLDAVVSRKQLKAYISRALDFMTPGAVRPVVAAANTPSERIDIKI
jgi:hypothetical protein